MVLMAQDKRAALVDDVVLVFRKRMSFEGGSVGTTGVTKDQAIAMRFGDDVDFAQPAGALVVLRRPRPKPGQEIRSFT